MRGVLAPSGHMTWSETAWHGQGGDRSQALGRIFRRRASRVGRRGHRDADAHLISSTPHLRSYLDAVSDTRSVFISVLSAAPPLCQPRRRGAEQRAPAGAPAGARHLPAARHGLFVGRNWLGSAMVEQTIGGTCVIHRASYTDPPTREPQRDEHRAVLQNFSGQAPPNLLRHAVAARASLPPSSERALLGGNEPAPAVPLRCRGTPLIITSATPSAGIFSCASDLPAMRRSGACDYCHNPSCGRD